MCYRILFAIALLLITTTTVGDTYNARNLAWNSVVTCIKELEPRLRTVQEYLQANEYQPRLKTIDSRAFVELDKAIKCSQELTKRLKKLQDEMK